MVGMRLYNRKQWKFKWKDLRISNGETQVQADENKVGRKEGIELGWSKGFGLDELDV
jgi:hypothetical protein